LVFILSIASPPLFAQAEAPPSRSFDEIFPGLSPAIHTAAFSSEGYFKSYRRVPHSAIIGPGSDAIGPRITGPVLNKNPGFIVESILVVPCAPGEYSLLDVYNAIGRIRGLKGRLYHSFTRGETIPLFEDVTRIESERRNVPVDDPPPAATIPASETIYMRLKDVNFGNSFYRGDIVHEQRGLRYTLTNNKSLTYFLVPVIKEEKFTAQLYVELLAEGILIYGLAGADVSDFVSSRIDMASAISKRLAVIIDWLAEEIIGVPLRAVAADA
jgi:hypothetical protein